MSTVTTVSVGGDTTCLIVNITSNIGNIISAIQSYRLCQIMNSETPDITLCKQIVQNQTLIKTLNYIAKVLNLFLCTGTPAASDYLSLVWDLLGIFPTEGIPYNTNPSHLNNFADVLHPTSYKKADLIR